MARRYGWMIAGLLILGLLTWTGAAVESMSGAEILQRVDAQSLATASGSVVATVHLEVTYSDGTTQTQSFGILTKTVPGALDRSLTCFLSPPDVAGMIFLRIKPQTSSAQMWLYLPALGEAKQFVAQGQGQSFAGGTTSYSDLGSREYADHYEATSVGHDTLSVDGTAHPCDVVTATARPGSDAEFPKITLWVDTSSFLVLRSEGEGEDGKTIRTMAVTRIGRFEDHPIAEALSATNAKTGAQATITFVDRVRPAQPIPDSVFDPQHLAAFSPKAYGWSL
jgi:outer membrane lipoprotein-sorting protein